MKHHVMKGLGAPRIVYGFPDRASLRAFLKAWADWRAASDVHGQPYPEPMAEAHGGSYACCPYIVEDVDDADDVVLMLDAGSARLGDDA